MPESTRAGTAVRPRSGRVGEVFLTFLKLGLTSFGGPIAHLGYFRAEFVTRREWLGDRAYSDLVALCQFLPGPASSKVGIAVGTSRAGLLGGLAAWIGFTMPSAIALIAFGYGVASFAKLSESGAVHGLKVAAVAVVAQAVWGMARNLCPDAKRASLAVFSALVALAWPTAAGQITAITICGLIGWRTMTPLAASPHAPHGFGVSKTTAAIAWVLFFALLGGLPLLSRAVPSHALAVFDSFYRSGSLVFGGGHVVLPLLRAEVVPPGWVTDGVFLAGYGAAQAVPGPLFTFSAYLGTVMTQPPNGWAGGMLCLVAIFLPSFLLAIGPLPFWEVLRARHGIQAALGGVNAAVVGLLLAALYDPVWTSAIRSRADFGLALAAFLLLALWKVSPVIVVAFSALGGWVLGSGLATGRIF
ncbi:MAG TPA: chromate efflux transporter [Burkholderiales bacterium]|nr:chromate efflux transporter [Burkholderiales bacterium]